MQLKLSDKIKKYRKEKELTQEGLAEAIGVTVGAVSKWENGNNVPDIMTLMQLANFFNISMDELLGFDLSSKNVDDMCRSIDEHCRNHEFDQGLMEAKDALLRYPHNFKVFYSTANLYYYRNLARIDSGDAGKAIEYFEKAMAHISQNLDPEISEYSIKFKIAYMYRETDPEKAVELLRQINYDGGNYNAIGIILSENLGRVDEALESFTYSLMRAFSEQLNTVFNIASVLATKGKIEDARRAVEMVKVELDLVEASAIKEKINYTHKVRAILWSVKACLHSRLGELEEMEHCVEEAYTYAKAFDGALSPSDVTGSIKFFFTKKGMLAHDTSGVGAIQSVDSILRVKLQNDSGKTNKNVKKVLDYWNKIKEEKEGEAK